MRILLICRSAASRPLGSSRLTGVTTKGKIWKEGSYCSHFSSDVSKADQSTGPGPPTGAVKQDAPDRATPPSVRHEDGAGIPPVSAAQTELESLTARAAAITKHCKPEQLTALLTTLKALRQRGQRPAQGEYGVFLAACKRLSMYDGAAVLMHAMREDGHRPTQVHYNMVIGAAYRARKLDKAMRHFERMQKERVSPTIVTYNTMVNVYKAKGDTEGIKRLVEEMQAAGQQPDLHIYSCLLGALATDGKVEEGMALLRQIRGTGDAQFLGVMPYRSLLRPLSKRMDPEACLAVWEDLKANNVAPDAHAFQSLISALPHDRQGCGRLLEVLDDYVQLTRSPPPMPVGLAGFTLRSILLAAWEAGDVEKAAAAVHELVKSGEKLEGNPLRVALIAALTVGEEGLLEGVASLAPPLALEAQLVAAFGALERWEDYDVAFAALGQRDARVYHTHLVALAKRGRVEEALGVAQEALGKGMLDMQAVGALMSELLDAGRWGDARRLMLLVQDLPRLPDWVGKRVADACAAAGQWEAALDTLRDMQRRGMRTGTRVYNAVLHGCSVAGEVENLKQMLVLMGHEGVVPDVQSYNTLLFALARQGDWRGAWRELQAMPSKGLCPDSFSYNAVIKAASTGAHWSMARRMLTRMTEAGIQPSVLSYNLVLAAFKGGEGWRAAREVLRQMRQAGLQPEEVSYNTLVHAYASAGRLGEALETLGQMVGEGYAPSAYTYGPLLRAAVMGGKWETAASLVEGMEQMGVRLPRRGAELKLAVLLRMGKGEQAEAYHAQLQRGSGEEGQQAMVDALIYAGMGEQAVGRMERLLEARGEREGEGQGKAAVVPVFTRAFAACRQVGGSVEIGDKLAEVMRTHGVPADVACLSALVHHTAEHRPADALRVLQEMRGQGLALTVPLYKSWLKLCRTQGDGPATVAVLDDMSANGVRDVDCLALAMTTLGGLGDTAGCHAVLQRFHDSGLSPTPRLTLACLHQSQRAGGFNKALERLNELRYLNWPLNTPCYNFVLGAAAGEQAWAAIPPLFEAMGGRHVMPDVATYNHVISAYGHLGQVQDALDTFEKIKKDGLELQPSSYAAVLGACGRAGDTALWREVFEHMNATGTEPDLPIFNSLVAAVGTAHGVAEGVRLLPLMRASDVPPDLLTYNHLLAACQPRGELEQGLLVLREAYKDGLRPSVSTLTLTMRACGGQWPVALYLYDMARLEGGLTQGDRLELLRGVLTQLGREVACRLFGRPLYRGEEREGVVRHWGAAHAVLDLHGFTRPMARCAVLDVLDDAVSGQGQLHEDSHALRLITGQNKAKGGSVLGPELVTLLAQLDPPLQLTVSPDNTGRFSVEQEVFWSWVRERRERLRNARIASERK